MDKEKIKFAVCFKRMKARLIYDEETLREINLNKGDVGMCVDYFTWKHEGESNALKHHVIIDLGAPTRGISRKPSIQIYPIAGKYVISKDPINAFWVNGEYSDYLDNHKHYSEDDES